jgi:hypothetical protein
MVKGKVAGAGRHAELLESCPEYATLVQRQLTAQRADADLGAAAIDLGPETATSGGDEAVDRADADAL